MKIKESHRFGCHVCIYHIYVQYLHPIYEDIYFGSVMGEICGSDVDCRILGKTQEE